MIKVSGLTKNYGSKVALQNISFNIDEKIIIGLVGNNGSGKSTLINCLLGYTQQSMGKIVISDDEGNCEGVSYSSILVDEKMSYDPFLSISKIVNRLELFSHKFDKVKCLSVIKEFNLPLNKKYSTLSKGMQNQFNIAVGMATRRDIIIYDEPVAGLDEVARDKFYKLLLDDYLTEPRIIIISTHLIIELQNMTQKIMILRDGSLVSFEETETLQNMFLEMTGKTEKLLPLIASKPVYKLETLGEYTTCIVKNELTRNEQKLIDEKGIALSAIKANASCKILCSHSDDSYDLQKAALLEKYKDIQLVESLVSVQGYNAINGIIRDEDAIAQADEATDDKKVISALKNKKSTPKKVKIAKEKTATSDEQTETNSVNVGE